MEVELSIPEPTLETASATREQVCRTPLARPTRDQLEVRHGLYIRGVAQQNDETARRWLDEGILTAYERTDNDDGTFVVNIEFDLGVIKRLADADEGLLDAFEQRRGELCG